MTFIQQASGLCSMAFLIAGMGLVLGVNANADVATIKVDGSSTVYLVTEAVAEDFQAKKAGTAKVTIGISGTGGGFKKFCRGETDVQNASRPIQETELEACRAAGVKFHELPIGYDAIVLAVNSNNTWLSEINLEDLKKMWAPEAQGKITKWNQVNPAWPDVALKLYGAGSDSGTFDYFTEAVVGKAKSSRGDYTASEDDNTLVQGISTDKGALGFIPLAYYLENKSKLKAVSIINPKSGKAVQASNETVENNSYAPLSRPLFIYVSDSALKRPEVKQFTDFYVSNAHRLVNEVKYVALPEKLYKLVEKKLKSGKMGTVYAGKDDGKTKLEDLLKKEGRL